MKLPEKLTSQQFNELIQKGIIAIGKKGRLKTIDVLPEYDKEFVQPILAKKKGNKFHAQKTVVDGITFDSKKEANYYLKLINTDGILNIERQLKYDIIVNGKKCGFYKLDFKVTYSDRIEHVDIKGLKIGSAYSIFRLKKKLVEALYNITIIEI